MRPLFELDPGSLEGTAFERVEDTVSVEVVAPDITHFREFVERRMASIVHMAETIDFLCKEDATTQAAEDQFMEWMAGAVSREHVARARRGTDERVHSVSHGDKAVGEYKRSYADDDPDTWTNLLYNTDPKVRSLVCDMVRQGNPDLKSELTYTLCSQLIHLCYDFTVNIWVHVGLNTRCCHFCEVLFHAIHDMLNSCPDRVGPDDLVEFCRPHFIGLSEAARTVFAAVDSLTLYTKDPRAIHATRWEDQISCSAMMRDGKWNEVVLIERALMEIYCEMVTTTRPLLCMRHTQEWNQLLRPSDLDSANWAMEITEPDRVAYTPIALDTAPFMELYDRLGGIAPDRDTPSSCTHDLLVAMPGVNTITFGETLGEKVNGDFMAVMHMQLSFDRVGETGDVRTVLVVYRGKLGLLVFERQKNRFEHAAGGPDGLPTDKAIVNAMRETFAP